MRGERPQALLDRGAGDPPAGGRGVGGERRVAARPAQQERIERLVDSGQPCLGHARRRAGADRVAVARHVLDRDPALLAADPHAARCGAMPPARCKRRGGVEAVRRARRDLVGPQVADAAKQIGHAVDGSRPARLRPGPAARAPGRPPPRGRAARAAPRRRAARPAGRGRGPGPARGARRAARRPRTCRRRRSRTGARRRTARRSATRR